MYIYQSGSGHVAGDSSMPTSIVRVDDKGSGSAPSGQLDVFDSPRLVCASGDASDAYRHAGNRPDAARELIGWTFNEKHLERLSEGWAEMPAGHFPDSISRSEPTVTGLWTIRPRTPFERRRSCGQQLQTETEKPGPCADCR